MKFRAAAMAPQPRLFFLLVIVQYVHLYLSTDDVCTDDDDALMALIEFNCATIAELSQLPATAYGNPGLCSVAPILLQLCCESCTEVNECASNPCANGAVCTDELAVYDCAC